jgi:hypothetical protein
MNHGAGPHLSSDDLQTWLDGELPSELVAHLAGCHECQERALVEQEIVEQLTALPLMSPAPGFADRVMQAVVLPDPFAIRSLDRVRRRLFASRRSLAVAASLAIMLIGSMAGSIVWSLAHQDTLAAWGSWLASQAGQTAWLAIRGVASNFIEQPWYQGARALADNPVRLAFVSGLATLVYLIGVLALRRLLALPTQQVAHARA